MRPVDRQAMRLLHFGHDVEELFVPGLHLVEEKVAGFNKKCRK